MSARDDALRARYPHLFRQPLWRRFMPLVITGLTLLYLAYAAWFFALPSVFAGAKWDRAGDMLAQWVSYDVFVEFRFDDRDLAPRYARYSALGADPHPDWVRAEGTGRYAVDIPMAQATIVITPSDVSVTHAGTTWHIPRSGQQDKGAAPGWMSFKAADSLADFGFFGEVRVSPDRVKIRHRFLGWANFIFDPNSPFFGKAPADVVGLLFSDQRLDPRRSNIDLAIDNFLNNAGWQHGDVLVKLGQTIVMAFVGTLFGGLIGLPLALLAARNITPNRVANVLSKRLFDFLRSVDMLIWALFFTRAFGPGPLAGIGAIFLAETGLLGKVYAEGFENIDEKQVEGIKSTGASPMAIQRFGVAPQVLPLVVSQTLYQWESNTRSATIIGAVGAGGIGLKLWEAMRTNSNWANVFYMVLLILVVVYVLDFVSGKLRQRLIGT